MQVGPLFACIMKRQFENLRDGDRFFFSHRRSGGKPRPGNSHPQGLPDLAKRNVEARSLGAILCDNLEASVLASKTTGKNVFRTVNPRTNQELDCRKLKLGDGILDLGKIFAEAVNEEIVNGDFSSILKIPQEKLAILRDEGSVQHFTRPQGNLFTTPVINDVPVQRIVGHPVRAHDLLENPPYTYSYSYGVRGNMFSQAEHRFGAGDLGGSYQVNLPRSFQKVDYHTNNIDGFVDDFSYPGAGSRHVNAHFAPRHPGAHRAFASPDTLAHTGRHTLVRHKPFIFHG